MQVQPVHYSSMQRSHQSSNVDKNRWFVANADDGMKTREELATELEASRKEVETLKEELRKLQSKNTLIMFAG